MSFSPVDLCGIAGGLGQKRTSKDVQSMSAFVPIADILGRSKTSLFYDIIGRHLQDHWHREAQRFRSPQVNHHIQFG